MIQMRDTNNTSRFWHSRDDEKLESFKFRASRSNTTYQEHVEVHDNVTLTVSRSGSPGYEADTRV